MFVNMYIFNNIACEFIYMNTHMYRVCITQTHTHVYMLDAVALIHKQLFSCLTFMVFFFSTVPQRKLITHASIHLVRRD